MATPRLRLFTLCLPGAQTGLALLLGAGAALAQPAAPSPMPATVPPAQATATGTDALSLASAALVGVRATAIEGASSVATLGQERSGSGVVISPDGLVLTIGYLILEAQDIRIITQDHKSLPAVPVAYDLATGFGLLRPLLPWPQATPAPLGSLQGLAEGEVLMAGVGATEDGMDADVSLTRLVGTRAFSGSWEYHIDTAAFTSPPVQAGRGNHSGAALFNLRGELVGIGSLRVMHAAGGARRLPGTMFVPVDLLTPILAELQRSGSSAASQRPWLGLNSAEREGRIEVLRVNTDSPAERAGLQAGDQVLAVDDDPVGSLEAFYKKLWARPTPDTPVRLTVQQGSEVRQVEISPQSRLRSLRKPQGI